MPNEIEAQKRLSDYYLEYAARQDKKYLENDQAAALKDFSVEWRNIRARLDWCVRAPETHPGKKALSNFLTSAPYCLDYHLSTQERRDYLEKALMIARGSGDRLAESRHLGDLGLTYDQSADYMTAASYQRQRILIAREVKDIEGECVALNNLGDHYRSIDDSLGGTSFMAFSWMKRKYNFYTLRALVCHQKAYILSRQNNLPSEEARALHWSGLAYMKLTLFTLAKEHLLKALSVVQNTGLDSDEMGILMSIGFYYRHLGDHGILGESSFATSLKYYKEAYGLSKRTGNIQDEMDCMEELGWAYDRVKQNEESIAIFEEGIKQSKEYNLKTYEERFLFSVAQKYEEKSKALSIQTLKEALKISSELAGFTGETLDMIGDIYLRSNDYKLGLEYYRKANQEYLKYYKTMSPSILVGEFYCKYPFFHQLRKPLFLGVKNISSISNWLWRWVVWYGEKQYISLSLPSLHSSVMVDLDEKIKEATQLIQEKPQYWLPYLSRGLAYSLLGERHKASKDFNSVLKLSPNQPDPYLSIAETNIFPKETLLEIINQGIKSVRKNTDLYHHRGLAFFDSGQYELAAKDFQTAITKGTKRKCTYSHLGLTLEKLGETEKSIVNFEKAGQFRNHPIWGALINYDFALKNISERDFENGYIFLKNACEQNSYNIIDRLYDDIDDGILNLIKDKKEFLNLIIEYIA